MNIARADKDKDGVWWVLCRALDGSGYQCRSRDEAQTFKDALNNAYELGREDKRSEIAEAQARLDDLLRAPLVDYYAEQEL